MSKGRSNHSSTSNDDFSLPKSKILRGRKNFSHLFERDAFIIRNKLVDIRFQIIDDTTSGCLMGFIVKKSLGKANKRNRMKRLLKEAYRLHQHMLYDVLRDTEITFHGALMAKTIDASYHVIEHNVMLLLEQVRDQLPTISSGNS